MDVKAPIPTPVARRRHGNALEQALLSAAWSELRSQGYQAFTIDAVAHAAGTSRAVIYRRWPNRAALVQAAVRAHVGTIEGHLPDTGSLAGDALAVLTILAGRIDQIGVDVTVGLFGELDEIPEEVMTIAPRAFAELIERARERGEIGSAPIPESVITMPTTLVRYTMIAERRAPSPDALRHIIDDLFLPLVQHHALAST
jgi:AcrR family transcriptional regulator